MAADTALWRAWRAYRLRWKRRYFLARALRRRRQLTPVINRTANNAPDTILLFSTVRNEMARLPHFLDFHRKIGVGHFLFVDNASDDGTSGYLQGQPDVSLWTTSHSYKRSRFGVDWLTWLQFRHGHGHWCLTLDADELFLSAHHGENSLTRLTRWLDRHGHTAVPALMLDLYPKGRISDATFEPGGDPLTTLRYFDADGYTATPRPELGSAITRGGPRARMFFADDPRRAPTLNKVPLVRWSRRFAYLTSTHVILPPRLNPAVKRGPDQPAAVLLHTKLLPQVLERSVEEKHRQEHFSNSRLYDSYYDALATGPDLWTPASQELSGWHQLESLGLLSAGGWDGR